MRASRRLILTALCAVAAAPALIPASAVAASDPTGPAVPIVKGASCLPGTWSLVLPNSPAGLSGQQTTSEGTVTLQIGPGRKLVETFASAVSSGQPGPGGRYLLTRQETTGTITANWTATVHKLSLTHVRNGTTAVSTVSIDDRTSEPATEKPAPETFPAKRQAVPYVCSGDTLTLRTGSGIKQGFTRTG